MKLSDFLEMDSAVIDGYEPRTVSWYNGKENVTFDIQVKVEMSAADFEFIFFRQPDELESDRNHMARRVHRLVRLDGEVIPFEVAKTRKTDLLIAMSAVLPNAQAKPAKN